MFIADCHCDTLSELYKQNKSLYANDLMLDAERIVKNGGGLQFMAMFIPTDVFRAGAGATYTLKLIDTYLRGLRELEQKGLNVNRILSREDLKKLPNGEFNTLLAIEEGGALDGSLEVLRVYYELGVRCMTLVWSNRNDIADGVNEECSKSGLTMFGRKVVAEMNRLGIAVDVSHISTYGFWDVLEHSTKPIIATHSCAYSLCDHPRNLRDDQLKALVKTGGFVGINFAGQFLTLWEMTTSWVSAATLTASAIRRIICRACRILCPCLNIWAKSSAKKRLKSWRTKTVSRIWKKFCKVIVNKIL